MNYCPVFYGPNALTKTELTAAGYGKDNWSLFIDVSLEWWWLHTALLDGLY